MLQGGELQGRSRTEGRRGAETAGRELLEMAAVDLAAKVRTGDLSASFLTEVCIRRIEQVNPAINAVVATRFEAALDEARAADDRLAAARSRSSGEVDALPPLLGVPCTIKDFLAVTGLPQTGGIVSRRNMIATRDAPLVARLRAAGAIVVGVTNVPEGGIWMETTNKLYGRTNNPWDLGRTPGGSSGGEGAIVAAGGVPFGLGSDIGGSVRIPAAFCGTVGHKASGCLLPNSGMFPEARGATSAFLCHGPLVRRVRDVMPLLRVMAGPDEGDPICEPCDLGHPEEVDLRGMVVYPIEESGRYRVAGSMKRAVREAARALEARGATIREAKLPALARGVEIWGAMLQEAAEGARYETILASGSGREAIDPFRELARALIGRSPHTLPALAVCVFGRVLERFDGSAKKMIEAGRRLTRELDEMLGDRGVLLYPPYTRPAPRHNEALFTPFDAAHTAVFNPTRVPGTVVPMGFDTRGLPVSVQIVAAHRRDHVALAAAAALEEEYGGWQLASPERLTR